jgi:hypothetical protein
MGKAAAACSQPLQSGLTLHIALGMARLLQCSGFTRDLPAATLKAGLGRTDQHPRRHMHEGFPRARLSSHRTVPVGSQI